MDTAIVFIINCMVLTVRYLSSINDIDTAIVFIINCMVPVFKQSSHGFEVLTNAQGWRFALFLTHIQQSLR